MKRVAVLLFLVAVAAAVYTSVGHGGASAYLGGWAGIITGRRRSR